MPSCIRRSDSLFTADEGGHRIDPKGVWRTDDMEAAVRRADAEPVDTKFGPPNIVRRGLLASARPFFKGLTVAVKKSEHMRWGLQKRCGSWTCCRKKTLSLATSARGHPPSSCVFLPHPSGPQVHPLIIRDPRTGRRSMLYFPAFFHRFVGALLCASQHQQAFFLHRCVGALLCASQHQQAFFLHCFVGALLCASQHSFCWCS